MATPATGETKFTRSGEVGKLPDAWHRCSACLIRADVPELGRVADTRGSE